MLEAAVKAAGAHPAQPDAHAPAAAAAAAAAPAPGPATTGGGDAAAAAAAACAGPGTALAAPSLPEAGSTEAPEPQAATLCSGSGGSGGGGGGDPEAAAPSGEAGPAAGRAPAAAVAEGPAAGTGGSLPHVATTAPRPASAETVAGPRAAGGTGGSQAAPAWDAAAGPGLGASEPAGAYGDGGGGAADGGGGGASHAGVGGSGGGGSAFDAEGGSGGGAYDDGLPVVVEVGAGQHGLVEGLVRWQVQRGIAPPEQLVGFCLGAATALSASSHACASAGAQWACHGLAATIRAACRFNASWTRIHTPAAHRRSNFQALSSGMVLQFDPSIGQHGAFYMTDVPDHQPPPPDLQGLTPPAGPGLAAAQLRESAVCALPCKPERAHVVAHGPPQARAADGPAARHGSGAAAHPALARARRAAPCVGGPGPSLWGSPTRRQLLSLASSLDALAASQHEPTSALGAAAGASEGGWNGEEAASTEGYGPAGALQHVQQQGPQLQQRELQAWEQGGLRAAPPPPPLRQERTWRMQRAGGGEGAAWERMGLAEGWGGLEQWKRDAISLVAAGQATAAPDAWPPLAAAQLAWQPPPDGAQPGGVDDCAGAPWRGAWGSGAGWQQEQPLEQQHYLQPPPAGRGGHAAAAEPWPRHAPGHATGAPDWPAAAGGGPCGDLGCDLGGDLGVRFDDSLLDLLIEVEQLEVQRDGAGGRAPAGPSGGGWHPRGGAHEAPGGWRPAGGGGGGGGFGAAGPPRADAAAAPGGWGLSEGLRRRLEQEQRRQRAPNGGGAASHGSGSGGGRAGSRGGGSVASPVPGPVLYADEEDDIVSSILNSP